MMNCLHRTLASFCFFFLFDKKMSPYFSNYLPKYKKLTLEQKNDWNSRNTSTFHATIVTLVCMYVILFDEMIKKDLVRGYSRLAESNISIAFGYLSSDLVIMLLRYNNIGNNIGYITHHLSSLYAYWFALNYGLLSYFANFRLLAEMSTPFVNLRWSLSVSGTKGGSLYFYNGVIMTATFFASRILLMPYYYYMVVQVASTEAYNASVNTLIHVSWIGVCVVLDILNIFWFRKMLSGVMKHLIVTETNKDHIADAHGTNATCNGSSVTDKIE